MRGLVGSAPSNCRYQLQKLQNAYDRIRSPSATPTSPDAQAQLPGAAAADQSVTKAQGIADHSSDSIREPMEKKGSKFNLLPFGSAADSTGPGPWWWGDARDTDINQALKRHHRVFSSIGDKGSTNGVFAVRSVDGSETDAVLTVGVAGGKFENHSLARSRRGVFTLDGKNIPAPCMKIADA